MFTMSLEVPQSLFACEFKVKLSQPVRKSRTGICSNGFVGFTRKTESTSTALDLDQSAQNLTPHAVHALVLRGIAKERSLNRLAIS